MQVNIANEVMELFTWKVLLHFTCRIYRCLVRLFLKKIVFCFIFSQLLHLSHQSNLIPNSLPDKFSRLKIICHCPIGQVFCMFL